MTHKTPITIDKIVHYYIQLRDEKDAITRQMRKSTEDINATLKRLEGLIYKRAKKSGVTSFRTKHGVAFLETTASCSVKDWDALLEYVKREDAYYMLNKAVNKTAVREYLVDFKVPPPGVNYGERVSVKVRRA